jgi:hypothetical protein
MLILALAKTVVENGFRGSGGENHFWPLKPQWRMAAPDIVPTRVLQSSSAAGLRHTVKGVGI